MSKYNLYFITSYEGEFPKGISINDFKYRICNYKKFLGQVELDEKFLGKQIPGFDNIEGTQSEISIRLEQGIKLNKKMQLMHDFLMSLGYTSLYKENIYQISLEGARHIQKQYNIFVLPNTSWCIAEKI